MCQLCPRSVENQLNPPDQRENHREAEGYFGPAGVTERRFGEEVVPLLKAALILAQEAVRVMEERRIEDTTPGI